MLRPVDPHYAELEDLKGKLSLPRSYSAFREKVFKNFQEIGLPHKKSEAWQYINQKNLFKSSEVVSVKSNKNPLLKGFADIFSIKSFEQFNGALKPVSVSEKDLADKFEGETDPYANFALGLTNKVVGIEVVKDIEAPINLSVKENYELAGNVIVYLKVNKDIKCELGLLLSNLGAGVANIFLIIEAEPGSRIEINCVQDSLKGGNILLYQRAKLGQNSFLSLTSLFCGAAIARNDFIVDLNGENSYVSIDCLNLPASHCEIHHYLNINHNTPYCESHQLFRNLMAESSTVSVDGTVNVKKGAKGSLTSQLINSLYLGENAAVKSKPNLFIANDDVKCSHGNTCGQLEEDALFYLKSRGLSDQKAKDLLVKSFADEILNKMKNKPIHDYVSSLFKVE